MFTPSKRLPILAAALIFASATSTLAHYAFLPNREGPRPQTTNGAPHIQLDVEPVPALIKRMLDRVEAFSGVTLGATRVSLPGAVGFQLGNEVALANPDAIVGGREFVHVHPDVSLHAALDLELARAAVQAG